MFQSKTTFLVPKVATTVISPDVFFTRFSQLYFNLSEVNLTAINRPSGIHVTIMCANLLKSINKLPKINKNLKI